MVCGWESCARRPPSAPASGFPVAGGGLPRAGAEPRPGGHEGQLSSVSRPPGAPGDGDRVRRRVTLVLSGSVGRASPQGSDSSLRVRLLPRRARTEESPSFLTRGPGFRVHLAGDDSCLGPQRHAVRSLLAPHWGPYPSLCGNQLSGLPALRPGNGQDGDEGSQKVLSS